MARKNKLVPSVPQAQEAATVELRKARLVKGISLEQIADATKISLHFLRAIEAEEYAKLPGGIFNTSYLRQYAAAVDLEAALVLAQYRRIVGAEADALNVSVVTPAPTKSFLGRWFGVPAQVPHS